VFDDETIEDRITGYMSLQCMVRELAPDTVSATYLPGIAAHFDSVRAMCSKSFRTAINSKEVKFILRGIERSYAKLHPASGKVKLAYSMDYASRSKVVMRKRGTFSEYGTDGMRIKQKQAFVAQALPIYIFLRKSEHIAVPAGAVKGTAITLTRQHITFFDEFENAISYDKVGIIMAASVAVNVPYSKTDAKGFGRINSHTRQPNGSEVDIVVILEDWICDTRDNYGTRECESIYAINNMFPVFNVNTLHMVMQLTLDDLGIPGLLATSHKLRYGGASMLAAAGFPHYVIAMYGGWSPDSKALRLYTKASKQLVELVSAHMAKMAIEDGSKFFINNCLIVAKGK
jgi:hypothetical protein